MKGDKSTKRVPANTSNMPQYLGILTEKKCDPSVVSGGVKKPTRKKITEEKV